MNHQFARVSVEHKRTVTKTSSKSSKFNVSFVVATAFFFVHAVAPYALASSASAYEYVPISVHALLSQNYAVEASSGNNITRDNLTVTRMEPPAPTALGNSAVAPAAGKPDPGSAKSIAYDLVAQKGWDQSEYNCLVSLWSKESGWNVYAHNASSGAYGIPQSLPGNKMASAGSDWQTNPETQIRWGLNYIAGRYNTPCGAWGSSVQRGWY